MTSLHDGCLHGVRAWMRGLRREDCPLSRSLKAICGGRADLHAEAVDMALETLEAFGSRFGMAADVLLVRSAGRVNILGTHIDHRGGSVNPIAVHHMWLVAAPRDDDRVIAANVESNVFHEECFGIAAFLPEGRPIDDWDQWCHTEFAKRRGDGSVTWSTYVRAAVLYMQHVCTRRDGTFSPALRGMNLMFYGDVPRAAGVSSSSAVVVATAEAVVQLNGLDVTREDLVTYCGRAEWYVGTRGGSSDHAAIICGAPGAISHLTASPLTTTEAPLPSGYALVLADSGVEAKKQEAARNIFNSRIAAYEVGLMMIRRHCPEHAERLEHLRDVNPETLGVTEADVYRIVRTLPIRLRRAEILQRLPGQEAEIHRAFQSHDEPEDGYPIRGVCLYGIAECIRSNLVPACLASGDMKQFGELMNASHNGDRVTRWVDGQSVSVDKSYSDERLDALIAEADSGDPARLERARLWRQAGAYDCSLPEVDALVDIALASDGVVGAGLVGAGMGGCVVAVVASEHAEPLIANMTEQYYGSRDLPPKARIVTPVGGLRTFEL